MREIMKLGGKLLLISAIAGLALGVTNGITAGPIAEQARIAANAARREVFADAADFIEIEETPEGLMDAYTAVDGDGQTVGFTGKITVTGYGGPIEVTVGVSKEGKVTGISVGGSDFSETAGLGAKTKEPGFTEQFKGLNAADTDSIYVKADGGAVDAVSSATVSSRAVTGGVRTVCTAFQSLLTEGN